MTVDRIILYFILVLAIIAVSLWTIFLIQLTQIVQETRVSQQQHITGSLEARQNLDDAKQNVIEAKQSAIEAKETAKQTLNISKSILGNVTEINKKLK